ncbi:MAG: peptide deformylase [Ruminococcaceae bacterium]|nr:peptide deformylase [Oscillospiraceae bacterium]
MAIRSIITDTDPLLHKVCRPVEKFDERLWQLLDDMSDTLAKANGVGLAAPQVGVLRRLFIMNTGDGVKEYINPTILEESGTQECVEGCLSSPGEYGIIHRPQKVKIQAQNRNGKFFIQSLEGLAAECVCHETDHLDGVLFKSKVVRMLSPEELAN